MLDRDLPKRPGEYGPDDAGKKGGSPEQPIVDEPTDVPRGPSSDEGDTRKPPA
jgi:hypothetical protein